jgi:N-acetylmuramoyl-L-alanine amidase
MEKRCSRRNFLNIMSGITVVAALSGLGGCKEKEIKFPERVYSSGPAKYLILDSGHGGETTGTVYDGNQVRKLFSNDAVYKVVKKVLGGMIKGACEDEVAYDILCRVKKRDNENKVYPIIKDKETGYKPIGNLALSTPNTEEYVVVGNEEVKLTNAAQGINERVKAINKYYSSLRRAGISGDNIYLVSIHADEAPEGREGAFSVYPSANAAYGGSAASSKSRSLEERLRRNLDRQGIKTMPGYAETERTLGIFKTLPHNKVILETGNMSDFEDYKKLNREEYREKIAEAIISLVR